MIELCLGTYLTIILNFKLKTCTQKRLVGTIMHSMTNKFDETNDSLISNIVNGRKNPPDSIVELGSDYLEENYGNLIQYFSEEVIGLIDPNKFSLLEKSFTSLVMLDKSIAEDCVVDLISQTTKADIILSGGSPTLLPGLLLYVLRTTDNINKEQCVRELKNNILSEKNINKMESVCRNGIVDNKCDEATFLMAQEFCINYENELELLPLCQIAASYNSLHNYVRSMYTDYCKCSASVKNMILHLKKCPIMSFDDNWIFAGLNLFEEETKRMNIRSVDYLYDGAKYFRRAFDRYSDCSVDFDPWVFDHLIEMKQFQWCKDSHCNMSTYIQEYLEKRANVSVNAITPPLDLMWEYCSRGDTPEYQVTYWVCMSIISVCSLIYDNKKDAFDEYNENDVRNISLGDSEDLIKTQEDMYLYALLELYKLYRLCEKPM